MENNKAIQTLNELLQGEISAVETYQQAVKKERHSSDAERLQAIQQDHQSVVENLYSQVNKLGGEPKTGSGAWGIWAKTVEGTASVFGDKAAIKALKEGEEHGIREYREALENDDFPSECKSFIRNTVLPKQHEHIQYLDGLLQAH